MSATAGTLLLGAARRKITPPLGVPLVGYPKPRPNTGVAHDLFVRAALFAQAGSDRPAAALLVLDTISLSAPLVERMRQTVAQALPGLPPRAVMIAAIHTHAGPRLYEELKDGQVVEPDPDVVELTLRAVLDASVAAWTDRAEVKARIGLTEVRLGVNRRIVDSQGSASNRWEDPEGLATGYFNPNVRFIVFDDVVTGRPRLILEHYGCHPVVGGQDNTLISPDYPGYLVDRLEAVTGAPLAIHITGAAANINPRDCGHRDVTKARFLGEAVADRVIECLDLTRPLALAPVLSVSEPLIFPPAPSALEHLAHRVRQTADGNQITSEVQVLRLGGLAFVSAPGELFAEIGVSIENLSPFPNPIIVSNADDALGYLVTEAAWREGAYERKLAPAADIEPRLLAVARKALARAANPD